MNWQLILCFMVALISCKQNRNEATLDYDKIRPKPSNPTNQQQGETDSLQIDLQCFNRDSVQLAIQMAQAFDTAHFLNRFTDKEQRKFLTLKTNHTEITFGAWKFRDSLQRKNAVFNWLDHFGEKEISVQWLKATPLGKRHQLILINASSIIELNSPSKLEIVDWVNYQRFNFPKDSLRFLISSTPNKKCQWYRHSTFNKLLLCQP